ncbi:MAG: secondary thiamine-phosphate synthase enzyme YjbQ [Lentimicrobium sp.]|mgnify:CR=1 FL=1|jgi:secondary thiamine-phosphate synthase enzyme|nr:secondary thiamine-phosphate synthase enzyme YjbQ [Lentimicrobium sp.]MDD4597108.1 secondary thiamine-phosphate synthase enzyme YjbQ [Lentimicrobiaceae bacterium]MDY0025109.1 secondary thiamine-phosphate synthase enzyme YjbQ [Lentimicrobium sp.]HAH59582.1 secondary thiamine-phosphate synthase [Bacteroidales bacterium]
MIKQINILLPEHKRGFHLITDLILERLPTLPETGLLHLFIRHTSAGICINENADPTVLYDFETVFNKLIPEDKPWYQHTMEGSDDMPAHIKSVLTGCELTIPISHGQLNMGTWQGIYLCEFRNHGGRRNLVATIYG